MIKTGLFPVVPHQLDVDSLTEYQKKAEGWVRVPVSNKTKNFFLSILAANFETSSTSSYFMGATSVVASGVPTPVPPVRIVNWPKLKTNNKPFQKRVNEGSIVVSPYQVGQTTFTFKNGGNKTILDPVTQRALDCRVAYYAHGRGSIHYTSSTGDLLLIDEVTGVRGLVVFPVQRISLTDSRTVFDNGFTIPDDGYFTQIPWIINPGLVIDNTAAANTTSVDMLTALAEAPETIKYIFGIITSVLKIYKDARKKDFRLHNKVKRVRLTYDERLAAINKEISYIDGLAISNGAKRRRKAELVRRKKQLKEQFKKDSSDLLSAIADLWLQFRYAIMPNVYLIEGAVEALEKKDQIFQRWAKTLSTEFYIDNFDGNFNVKNAAFIKRKFMSASLSNNISFNLFLTAWELIPLSFVIDWFINVGNTLSATLSSFIPSGIEQEGATYSWKVSGSAIQTFDDGSSVSIDLNGYKRTIIITQDFCGFQFNPDLNNYRIYDSIALSWNLALKRLLK